MLLFCFFSICIEMDSVKKVILKRDNYKCQDCNISKKKLTIHHIKESHKHPELKFKRSNLITLCQRCHSLRHNKKIEWLVVIIYHHYMISIFLAFRDLLYNNHIFNVSGRFVWFMSPYYMSSSSISLPCCMRE
jgi:hypothetical protein